MRYFITIWTAFVAAHLATAQHVTTEKCDSLNVYGIYFVNCDNITSLREISPTLYGANQFRLYLSNSSLSLTKTESFNSSGLRLLSVISSNISHIDQSFFENASLLRDIIITGNRIEQIEAFPKLKRLDTIHFDQNKIKYIPTNLWNNLSKLRILFFEDNSMDVDKTMSADLYYGIEHFPSHLFLNTSMEYLLLGGNGIVTVEEDTFGNLPALKELAINRNRISLLPAGIFQSLSSLTELNLDSNLISTLSEQILAGLHALEILILSNNQIESVSSDWFANLPSLRLLNLSANKISDFDLRINSLSVLDLSKNNLGDINTNLFEGMPSLENLDLSFNLIENISRDAFKGISDLQILNLESNQISHLSKGVFEMFSNFSSLSLSGNRITDLGKIELDNLRNLLQLNLSNNDIKSLSSAAFQDLEILEELDLTNIQLNGINRDMFRGLGNLKKINVSRNTIEQLPKYAFEHLTELQYLHLNDIQLTELHTGTLKVLRNLTYLYVEDNQITSVSPTLFNDINVEEVSLRGNPISYLEPDPSRNVSTVKTLNLENTPIQSLDFIANLPVIRYLYLRGTEFENQPLIVIDDRSFQQINSEVWEIWRNLI